MKNLVQKVQFDISPMLILKVLGVALALVFIYLVRDVILVLFISFIFASAITPWVDYLQERKIPRVISVLAIYLLIFGLIAAFFVLVIPPMTTQLEQLANNLPHYYNEASKWLANADSSSQAVIGLQNILQRLTENLTNGASGAFSWLSSFFGTMFKAFLVLVITFYITLQKDSVKKFVQTVTTSKYQPYAVQLMRRIQDKMGSWMTGQLFLGVIIGVLAYVALTIMGIKYALILAIFAGITELIPFIGPLIGMIPAVFLAFLQSPILGLITFLSYMLIQQLENNLIVPLVMKKAVGLNPIITIVAITIGGNLAGVAGAIIAIPLTVVISILAKDAIQLGQDIEKI